MWLKCHISSSSSNEVWTVLKPPDATHTASLSKDTHTHTQSICMCVWCAHTCVYVCHCGGLMAVEKRVKAVLIQLWRFHFFWRSGTCVCVCVFELESTFWFCLREDKESNLKILIVIIISVFTKMWRNVFFRHEVDEIKQICETRPVTKSLHNMIEI